MAGYTRSYNKSTGNTIEAADFNTEFQLIDDAFNASTGHAHDGSTDNGGYVSTISDSDNKNSVELDSTNDEIDFNVEVGGVKTRQFVLADGAILPDTDNDVDLGSATFEFKDLYIDGTANIDSLVADAGTIGGVNIVGISTTQTLTNKTIVDTSNTLTITAATVDNVASGNLVATDVQAALNELQGDIDSLVSGTISAIGDIGDVVITGTPADNEVLAWNTGTSRWINQTAAEAGLATSAQGALADSAMQDLVDDTTPQLGGNLDVNAKTITYGATQVIKLDSTGRVLIGTATSDAVGAEAGAVTISTGNSGESAVNAKADDLIIENNADAGITVLVPDSGAYQSRIAFGSLAADQGAGIRWLPDSAEFRVGGINPASNLCSTCIDYNNGTTGIAINTSGNIICGDSTSDSLGADTGSVTISTGNSGVSSPPSGADDLVIEGSGNTTGIGICMTAANNGQVAFITPSGNAAGLLYYAATDQFVLRTTSSGGELTLQVASNDVINLSETVVSHELPTSFKSYTTTQRNALTPSAGWVIWNTTDTKLQVYNGSTWANMH